MGVAYYDGSEVTLADIPGLVEGAHEGIGLGDKFLRHIERCKVLLHLIDLGEEDLVNTYKQINSELYSYSKKLNSKKELIFFNKSDLFEKNDIKINYMNLKKRQKKYEVISVFSKKDIIKIKKLLIKYASQ